MMGIGTPMTWGIFIAFVVVALVVDFAAMRGQGAHRVGMREAAIWSVIWVLVSFVFVAWLWWRLRDTQGLEFANTKALEFVTGYLVEKALAVDNIFVFLMVFTYFGIPAEYQKRVLMIGIMGAIALRAVLILVGAWLLQHFHWLLYVFGAFLLGDRHQDVVGRRAGAQPGGQPGAEVDPQATEDLADPGRREILHGA